MSIDPKHQHDMCLCGHWREEHTKPNGPFLLCGTCKECVGFASRAPCRDAVCVHVARGELEPFMLLVISAGPAFAPPTDGPIVRRLKCCALCLGWIEAVTRFGLPVHR